MTETHMAILLDRFVRRMHAELRSKAPQFDTENVGPGGGMILLTLDELGTVPMQALTRAMVRDKSQMTREVASLERKGLITRAPNPDDQRVTLIELSETGNAAVQRVYGAIGEALDDLLIGLAAQDKETLGRLLSEVVRSMPEP